MLTAACDAAAVAVVYGVSLLQDGHFALVHVGVGEVPAEVAVGFADELIDVLDAVVAQESRACAAKAAISVLPEELAARELRQRLPEGGI